MNKIAIVTDSTSYIPDEYLKKYNITVLPLLLVWGEEILEDGVDIQPNAFYIRLANSKTMPTTSQVSMAKMIELFSNLINQGNSVLGIFVSSKLSGTFETAIQARDMLTTGKEKVELVDSQTSAMQMGFQTLKAAEAAMGGASLLECKTVAENSRPKTGMFFVVDTLEFLHRGGRIGGAQRLLGTALNLKPILTVRDGKVESIERIRTKSKAMERLVEIITEQCAGKSAVRLAAMHANAEDDAKYLLEMASKSVNTTERILSSLSPVVGAHTGPGTLALAYLIED